jgi:CTP:molybdopterin cytidylyltransferase MocA
VTPLHQTAPPVLILIPAAGASSRMRGGDKLLEQVDGTPQIARAVTAALASACTVAVTLRPEDTARAAALAGLHVTVIPVPDAATGMSASLRRGAATCPPGHALMVLPADMPDIGRMEIDRMLAAQKDHPDRILRATAQDGSPGNPVLFPPRLVPRFADLTGDEGARRLLAEEAPLPVRLPMRRALTDLDTPEDWAVWRAMRDSPGPR